MSGHRGKLFDPKILGLAGGFALALLATAWLRLQTGSDGIAGALSGYATLIYVGSSVLAAVYFIRAGIPIVRLGFRGDKSPLYYIALAAAGVALLQLSGLVLEPLWEQIFGSGRDLTRFDAVKGSFTELAMVLALSWTVAAFGEEIAFRILLMRGVAFALGDSRIAFAVALVTQAIIFGVVHAYQGPAAIAGATFSGLIYGGLTLAARGSIWPAALAHGLNNTIGLVAIFGGA